MWEADSGAVPVVDAEHRVVGMITDRDICMASMQNAQVRRVPALDGGGYLKGILSKNDLARHTHRTSSRKADGLSGDSILKTLAAICDPHRAHAKKEPAADGVRLK